jgi:hypothetical protein
MEEVVDLGALWNDGWVGVPGDVLSLGMVALGAANTLIVKP